MMNNELLNSNSKYRISTPRSMLMETTIVNKLSGEADTSPRQKAPNVVCKPCSLYRSQSAMAKPGL